MFQSTRSLIALFVAAATTVSIAAATPSTGSFVPGDRWCAVGDSITHGGLYHSYVYLYYATRFPDRPLSVYNCGISGDTAVGTLRRLQWDILDKKPTVASIMLGMNDVGVFAYGADKTGPADKAIQQAAIDTYTANMTELVKKLKDAGIRLILITPSIYDQTATIPCPLYYGANDGLLTCSKRVIDMAKESGAAIVDFNTPMARINRKVQASNPSFTLVGGDRVHPGEVGHFVMAYQFLKGQGAPQYVSYTSVDCRDRRVSRSENCTVSDLRVGGSTVSFTSLEKSLPFPVSDGVAPALDLVPFTPDFNQEILQLTGLGAGRYSMKIDGTMVGEYDAEALAEGINLATVKTTPQYKQAAEVMEINLRRFRMEADDARWIALMEFVFYPDRAKGAVTLDQVKPAFEKMAEDSKGTPSAHVADWVQSYMRNKPREAEINRELEALSAAMYSTAQPRPHIYVIAKVKAQ